MQFTKALNFLRCQIDRLVPSSACWKDGFVEGGLDNTFTRYTNTNQTFNVTFDDGSAGSFVVPSATSWTNQVDLISAGLAGIMPWAATVSSFCNISGGCGGLPEPILVLNQMVARYTGFRVCHGGKVPVSVTYTSDQLPTPKELILQYKASDVIWLDRCFTCGVGEKFFLRGSDTEYTPVCPTPCGFVYPDTPLVTCTNYPPVNACDDMGTADASDNVAIVILYSDCGNGIETSYMQTQTDNSLEPYTLVGTPVDCASGLPVPDPEPEQELKNIFRGDTQCISVDGVAQYGLPVSQNDVVTWHNPDLSLVSGTVLVLPDCDCQNCDECGCPEIDQGDSVRFDADGNPLPISVSFPYITNGGQIEDFVTPFSVNAVKCLTDADPATLIPIRYYVAGHDVLTGSNASNGFNVVVDGTGVSTSESATNTVDNTANFGGQTAAVGTLVGSNDVADRWVEFDIPLGELLDGVTFTTSAVGSLGNGATETIADLIIYTNFDWSTLCEGC